jgi:hypothetical protein
MYLPATFIYQDVSFSFAEKHVQDYMLATNMYHLTSNVKGSPVYPVGCAVLWSPFFALAHLYTKISNSAIADGLSTAYSKAIWCAAIFYLWLGLYCLRKFLLHFVSDSACALTLIAICIGTNFTYYHSFAPGLSHIYGFAMLSAFLYQYQQYQLSCSNKNLIVAALAFALAALCRNTEVLLIIVPVLYNLQSKGLSMASVGPAVKESGVMLFALGLCYCCFQMPFYWLSCGKFFANGYSNHGFNWLSPQLAYCFFSATKGWFVFTPLMLLAVIGIYFLFKQKNTYAFSIVIFMCCILYITICWDDRSYGTTYGFRPVVQYYALLALPFALLVERTFACKAFWRAALLGFLTVCCVLNLFWIYQFNKGILLISDMNWAYRKEVALATQVNNHDKLAIYLPSYSGATLSKPKLATAINDTIIAYGSASPNFLTYVPVAEITNIQQQQRFAISLHYSISNDSFNIDNAARLVCHAFRGDSTVYWTGIALAEVSNNYARDSICFTQHIPACDKLAVYLWHSTPETIGIWNFRMWKEL